MRTLGLGGLSVTTPHKEDVAAAVDALAPAAAALRSVNTVVWSDGRLVGHSTDGDGFVASLAASGVERGGRAVAVVGAGAAARSVVDALGRAGAADVAIVNRTPQRAAEAAALSPAARVGSAADIAGADIVVNATSVGLGTDDAAVRPGAAARRARSSPTSSTTRCETALLRAAAARGCTTVDGLGMLVHQAVLQQQLWTGMSPDPATMRAAALAELARRA